MNYFVKRGDQQYGPYTLAALQQYVQQGNISKDDLARSEAMVDWVFVSQIVGNVSVAAAPGSFGAVGQGAMARPMGEPLHPPPSMHWALLLVLSIFTLGLFLVIWLFVQAVWLRKVRPQSRSLFYFCGYVAAAFLGGFMEETEPMISALSQLASIVFFLAGTFSMRSGIEDYYNTDEPISLKLSGVMTFFFHGIYFQYHFNDIKNRREQGMRATAGGGVR